MPNRITLRGCAPDPLIHYLKALGVLRLVAEQFDPNVRGAWHGDAFVLATDKTLDELLKFFLKDYCPTPIVAPWNGSSGFYPKDNQEAINAIFTSNDLRFADYRETIARGREIASNLPESPKDKEEKANMLRACRRAFPDRAVAYLDTAFVFGAGKTDYSPLLGTGGNDGHFEFSNNFMAHLLSVLPPATNDGRQQALHSVNEKRLRATLFGEGTAKLEKAAVGQFYPGGAGGANASQGPSGGAFVNPWDFVFCFEGVLAFAGASVRRLAAGASARMSFPFTVNGSLVGYGTAASGEDVRSEMWLPLWSRMASSAEVLQIFSEGRAQLSESSQRAVRNGFDFARAVAGLGVDRGIDAFQRYGFIKRYGKMYLATSHGRFEVRERPRAALIYQVDRWLDNLRRATRDTKRTPPRFVRARGQVEEAIFNLCASGEAEDLRATLIRLGEAEREIARGPRFREEHGLRPISGSLGLGLSEHWARECDDGTPEFELAAALASITGEGKRGAFRTSLEPVEVNGGSVNWTTDGAGAVWGANALDDNLAAVLQRRSIDARGAGLSHPLLTGRRVASLRAVDRFLRAGTDDERIEDERLEELLRGLALINWRNVAASDGKQTDASVPPSLPRAYALLKLMFLPAGKLSRARQAEPVEIKHEPSIIPLLRAGRLADALEIAQRRLRSSGLVPFTNQFHFPDEDGARLAAALLIPISKGAASLLAETVLRPAAQEI